MKPDPADPLESQLRQLPLRSLPANWRREILATAEVKTPSSPFLAWLPGRWFTLPLAAAWVVIALLRIDTPPPEPSTGPAISPQAFAAAQEEKRILIASLNSLSHREPAVPTWPIPYDQRPL